MKKIVIIGCGLAGSILANELSKSNEVSVIDLKNKNLDIFPKIEEKTNLRILEKSYDIGFGGTTQIWHNGLTEIENENLKNWSIKLQELKQFHSQALELFLSKKEISEIDLKQNFIINFFKKNKINNINFGKPIIYPILRQNLFQKFKLNKKKNLHIVAGYFDKFFFNKKKILYLKYKNSEKIKKIYGDIFILCAGGLFSPFIIDKFKQDYKINQQKKVGSFFEDHPQGYVAEFRSNIPFYKIWNTRIGKNSLMRLPVVIKKNRKYAFQIRPSYGVFKKKIFKSNLSNFLNSKKYFGNFLRILLNPSDFLEILSFRFGINLPTQKYYLHVICETKDKNNKLIFKKNKIIKKLYLDSNFYDDLFFSIKKLQINLKIKNEDISVYNFKETLYSSAHFSGTIKISKSKKFSNCDTNNKVFGVKNLYVCDGSVINESGYSNTGLSIAALSYRLSKFLK